MEMGELFLQLCKEVARLQHLCTKQGELLQKLMARKGPVLDIPVSLPVQCTEDMGTGEGALGSHQGCSEAPAAELEGSAHTLARPDSASSLPTSDGKNPPGAAGREALALGFGTSEARGSGKGDVDTWLKTPRAKTPEEEARAWGSPRDLAPNSALVDSFLALLDLREAPGALQREDAPRDCAVSAEDGVPGEIRGPVKTSWSPGWVLEDGTLGQGAILTLEDALACDICQEVFPLDSAGQADYLKHILGHMK